jgi:hypothetical protein
MELCSGVVEGLSAWCTGCYSFEWNGQMSTFTMAHSKMYEVTIHHICGLN